MSDLNALTAKIYHNPRCSKSRQSFEILTSQGIAVEELRYLDNPPTEAELAALCQMMQVTPYEIVRKGEALFKTLDLAALAPENDQAWLKIMVENPILIERPIVKIGSSAIMGRPPENVAKLLQKIALNE